MSIGTVPNVMTRIKHAQPTSPIAVFLFTADDGSKALDAIFANTVGFERLVRQSDGFDACLGVFNRWGNMNEIREELITALEA